MHATLFPDLVVNGEVVSKTLIAAEAQNHTAPKGKPGIAWRKAANAIAIRTLLLQEARRRNLKPVPRQHGANRNETEDEALIRLLLETLVAVDAPSDDEIRTEWRRDPSRFRAPPLWEVSHILCACDPEDAVARKAAHLRARNLTNRIQQDPGNFRAFAKAESDCASAAGGGSLGQLRPGDTVPEFEAALRDLADGDVSSAPVLSRFGWHIIRMDAVAAGAELPYETVKQSIADAMERAVWARAARSVTNTLVKSARITGADLQIS